MRYELRDYQRDAAIEILKRLRRSRRDLAEGERSSFALSAITGSGKTVIATAVIEALYFGSTDLDSEPDPGVTILWITDDSSMAAIGLAATALAAAGLVAGAASGGGDRVLGWRPLAYVGLISYGLYLWHRPLMRVFTDSGLGGVPWAVVLMFAISLGLAFVSRRFVENPFLALKDRYFTSRAIRERAADGPRRESEDRTVAAEGSQ